MPESRISQKQREESRKKIEVAAQLQCITKAIHQLEQGAETVKVDGVEVVRPLDKTRVAAINAALNARFRLLAKVMPDLKAVELDLGVGAMGAVRDLSSIERAARIAFLLERLRAEGPGQAVAGGDTGVGVLTGTAASSVL